MKISYNKLKSSIPDLPDVNTLTEMIIFHAFEVEEIEKQGDDFILDIKVLPDRAFDAKTDEGMIKEISVITGTLCDREKIENTLLKLGGVEHEINISIQEIENKLGIKISRDVVSSILDKFWYSYKIEGDIFSVTIPSYRPDLTGVHDLIDEIMRIYGYENLSAELPKINFIPQTCDVYAKTLWTRNKLLTEGYSEVMTYTFCNKGEVEVLASASDKKFLRTNLTDGLKESIKLNQVNAPLFGMKEIKVFEIGTVFFKDKEELHVAYGNKKEVKEATLSEFCKKATPEVLSERSFKVNQENRIFKTWSMFPFIVRDIALWVKDDTDPENVVQIIKENMGGLVVRGPELFDEFKKDGRTSYAFRLIFQSYDRTLTDEEINVFTQKIAQELVSKGFEMR